MSTVSNGRTHDATPAGTVSPSGPAVSRRSSTAASSAIVAVAISPGAAGGARPSAWAASAAISATTIELRWRSPRSRASSASASTGSSLRAATRARTTLSGLSDSPAGVSCTGAGASADRSLATVCCKDGLGGAGVGRRSFTRVREERAAAAACERPCEPAFEELLEPHRCAERPQRSGREQRSAQRRAPCLHRQNGGVDRGFREPGQRAAGPDLDEDVGLARRACECVGEANGLGDLADEQCPHVCVGGERASCHRRDDAAGRRLQLDRPQHVGEPGRRRRDEWRVECVRDIETRRGDTCALGARRDGPDGRVEARHDRLHGTVEAGDHGTGASCEPGRLLAVRREARHRPTALAELAHREPACGGQLDDGCVVEHAGPVQRGQLAEAVTDCDRRLDAQPVEEGERTERSRHDRGLGERRLDEIAVRQLGPVERVPREREPLPDRSPVARGRRALAGEEKSDSRRAVAPSTYDSAERDAAAHVDGRSGDRGEQRGECVERAPQLGRRRGDERRAERRITRLRRERRSEVAELGQAERACFVAKAADELVERPLVRRAEREELRVLHGRRELAHLCGAGGACVLPARASSTTWVLIPPKPIALTAARRGACSGQGSRSERRGARRPAADTLGVRAPRSRSSAGATWWRRRARP